MTTNHKCIKYKCDYFCDYSFERDIYTICQVNNEYINGNCVGIKCSKQKAENLACKISKMVSQYNKLKGLEKFVRRNQYL